MTKTETVFVPLNLL